MALILSKKATKFCLKQRFTPCLVAKKIGEKEIEEKKVGEKSRIQEFLIG